MTRNGRVSIVRIVTRLNIGGPAIHTTLLTRELSALGYDTVLAAGECEDGEGDMSYLLEAGDRFCRIPSLSRSVSPRRNLAALFRLWRLIRSERPAIVHTHTAMAGCLGRAAAVLAGVPIIIHTFHGNSLRQYFSPARSAVFRMLERLLSRWTDAICVISPQQLDELSHDLKVAPRSKFSLVPLGLDLAPFLSLPLAAPVAVLRVGWFGRLVDVKNIGLLLETITALQNGQHHIEFHVAGDGPDRPAVEAALARLAPQLIWHGWQRDILPILAICDVLVQTSRNEGTPVALIQGMAAGRPCLSTAAGGVVDMTCGSPRALTPGARWFDNSVLVEPNADAFASALEECSRSPGRVTEMGWAARTLACASYRKEVLASNLDSLYRELLDRKCPHLKITRRAVLTEA
jgi:glycosyltransferase involved in cell wall biosynthesis